MDIGLESVDEKPKTHGGNSTIPSLIPSSESAFAVMNNGLVSETVFMVKWGEGVLKNK